MAITGELTFGALLSPVHSSAENPTLALARDVELIETLDDLGFDEVWVEEHHAGGWQYVASPEVLLAAVATRTRRIRLGGLMSLALAHPMHVAERYVLLDHLSRGRAMLGFATGTLGLDGESIGISAGDARRRTEQGIEAILALLEGERVSMQTDWFQLDRASLALMPVRRDGMVLGVSAGTAPTGPRLAGRHGFSLLSLYATEPAGSDLLASHWSIVEEQAQRHGGTADRRNWRLAGPMHVAETEERALAEAEVGLEAWAEYFDQVSMVPALPLGGRRGSWARSLVESGVAVIGTPDQAIAQIERLQQRSGGFGRFLVWANDWAGTTETRRSFELIARHVMPRFSGATRSLADGEAWARARRPDLQPGLIAARAQARLDYDIERAERIG